MLFAIIKVLGMLYPFLKEAYLTKNKYKRNKNINIKQKKKQNLFYNSWIIYGINTIFFMTVQLPIQCNACELQVKACRCYVLQKI